MAALPGLPGAGIPGNEGSIMRLIQTLQREVRELKTSLSQQTGMSFVAGGIRSATFDGDLDAATAGTEGWALGGTEDALIVNRLVAKSAIIEDDALASPVKAAVVNGVAPSLTFTGSVVTYETQTFTVPAGFTRALVSATATCGGSCPSGNATSLSVRCVISSSAGDAIGATIPSGGANSVSAPYARDITGLTGGQEIDVSAQAVVASGFPIVAGSGNARVSATAIFLRDGSAGLDVETPGEPPAEA